MGRLLPLCVLALLLLQGCQSRYSCIEPDIHYRAQEAHFSTLPSPFPPLTTEERASDWGRELLVAQGFARELDLYRAITSYKRSLMLMPPNETSRRIQAHYNITLAYYLGGKYQDAVNTFETGGLKQVTPSFPAYRELVLLLEDAYHQLGYPERAEGLHNAMEEKDATNVTLSHALSEGQLEVLEKLSSSHPAQPAVAGLMSCYCANYKSPETAENLSRFIPGAGYLYVGQRRSAITSFLLNGLFIWATYRFFEQEHYAAGLITLGFETGWYLGGINGAGIAAREYNEKLYSLNAKPVLHQEGLFPALMFSKGF